VRGEGGPGAGVVRTLYIIDGHAQFYRAFHAIRTPMTSPVTKEPTNATFGFVATLLKLLGGQPVEYLATVIDVSGDRETFRSEIYREYKANREPMPESLGPQVERCVSLLEEMGCPVLGVEGVEADDVIATLARRLTAEHDDLRVRIVSKDKDLMQLLEPGRIELWDPYGEEVIDVEWLKEQRGISPGQVIDYLALVGDTVDNVPGVEGIGPKTATTLLQEHGTVEALLDAADEIKGKRGERLRAARETLPMSKDLVTLRTDVGVEFDLEEADLDRMHLERLEPIFRELGFNRHVDDLRALIRKRSGDDRRGDGASAAASNGRASGGSGFGGLFDSHAAQQAVDGLEGSYEIVRTRKDLQALVKRLKDAERISVDTETTSTSAMRAELCGLSFSVQAGEAWYVPVRSPEASEHLDEEAVLEGLRGVLEDASRPKVGHNLKYDLLVLRRAGVRLRGIVFDTMVGAYLVDPARSGYSLDALALALLGHTCVPISDLIGRGKKQITFDQVPLAQAGPYAAEDADIALRLRDVLAPSLEEMGLRGLFDDLEMPLVEALAELEWNGVRIDPAELDRQVERLNERIDELRAQIADASPREFNPDSPKQLATILFNKPDDPESPGLGIRPQKRTKTGYSTDIEVLEKLAGSAEVESLVPSLIVEYRQLTKLVGTYLVGLKEAIDPRTKRIHASFNQTVAATGRLSSSDPNLQNIPIRTDLGRQIRRAFVAEEGNVFISADYSQIELRLLAHLSKDEALTEAFRRGEDIHRAVAAEINEIEPERVTSEQRSAAKMVNFGIVYGITSYGLARRLGVEEKTAAEIIANYKARFPGITVFLQECIEAAKSQGYVETMLGRRRPIPQIESRQAQQRSLGERMAINSVVQGSAADLIKIAMVDLHRRIGEAPEEEGSALRGVRMLLQIHDELLFEAGEESAGAARDVIVERMEGAMELRVPLVVDAAIGRTWFEGKG
jgi:DNA polymerase-1